MRDEKKNSGTYEGICICSENGTTRYRIGNTEIREDINNRPMLESIEDTAELLIETHEKNEWEDTGKEMEARIKKKDWGWSKDNIKEGDDNSSVLAKVGKSGHSFPHLKRPQSDTNRHEEFFF